MGILISAIERDTDELGQTLFVAVQLIDQQIDDVDEVPSS